MSDQNVDLTRRILGAANTRDIDAAIALCDPQIEYHSAMTTPGGAVYHGHDGVRTYFGDLEDAWGDEFRAEPEAYFDMGEHTLAFYVAHFHGRRSGVEVGGPGAALLRWRDGLCVCMRGYLHREDALRDLGISEDALKPIAP